MIEVWSDQHLFCRPHTATTHHSIMLYYAQQAPYNYCVGPSNYCVLIMLCYCNSASLPCQRVLQGVDDLAGGVQRALTTPHTHHSALGGGVDGAAGKVLPVPSPADPGPPVVPGHGWLGHLGARRKGGREGHVKMVGRSRGTLKELTFFLRCCAVGFPWEP